MKEKLMLRAAEIESWMELASHLDQSEKYQKEELEKYKDQYQEDKSEWIKDQILQREIKLKAIEKIREAILKAVG